MANGHSLPGRNSPVSRTFLAAINVQERAVLLDTEILHLALQGGVGRALPGLRRERGRESDLGRVSGVI